MKKEEGEVVLEAFFIIFYQYKTNKFARIGYIKIGYEKKDGEPYETAILTDLGRMVYYNERTLRNPIRRILHYIFEI